MDWLFVGTLALYVVAVTIAVSNARDYDWGSRKRAGIATFLLGAGFALFYDDAAAALGVGATVPPAWVEPVGAVVMLLGILVAYVGTDDEQSRDRS